MALGHREGNAFGRGLFVAVALSANLAIRAAAPLSRWDDRLRGSATSACDPEPSSAPEESRRPLSW